MDNFFTKSAAIVSTSSTSNRNVKRSFDSLIDELDQINSGYQIKKLSLDRSRHIINERNGLSLLYKADFLPKKVADHLLDYCESELVYYENELAKVKVFNKWHSIPRKQVAYGDEGLTYRFSGNVLPAMAWTPVIDCLKGLICSASSHEMNFVLINRYANGEDYMGEHRDNEKDLDPSAPIASLTVGRQRDFILRHAQGRSTNRNSNEHSEMVENVKIGLEHGSLLLMNPPTFRKILKHNK